VRRLHRTAGSPNSHLRCPASRGQVIVAFAHAHAFARLRGTISGGPRSALQAATPASGDCHHAARDHRRYNTMKYLIRGAGSNRGTGKSTIDWPNGRPAAPAHHTCPYNSAHQRPFINRARCNKSPYCKSITPIHKPQLEGRPKPRRPPCQLAASSNRQRKYSARAPSSAYRHLPRRPQAAGRSPGEHNPPTVRLQMGIDTINSFLPSGPGLQVL